jgi:hypothetical protein
MKLNISAELNGNELISLFLSQLKQGSIEAAPSEVKILVQTKDKEVELSPDRLRLFYSKTQV